MSTEPSYSDAIDALQIKAELLDLGLPTHGTYEQVKLRLHQARYFVSTRAPSKRPSKRELEARLQYELTSLENEIAELTARCTQGLKNIQNNPVMTSTRNKESRNSPVPMELTQVTSHPIYTHTATK